MFKFRGIIELYSILMEDFQMANFPCSIMFIENLGEC